MIKRFSYKEITNFFFQTPSTDTENQNSLGGEDMDVDSTSNHGNGQPAFGTPGGFTFAAQAPGEDLLTFNISSIFIS